MNVQDWKPSGSIAELYRKWVKNATYEELQQACNDVNALALCTRMSHESEIVKD